MNRSAQYFALVVAACLLATLYGKGIRHGMPNNKLESEQKDVAKVREKRFLEWIILGIFAVFFVGGLIGSMCSSWCEKENSNEKTKDTDDPYFTYCPTDIEKTIPKGKTSVLVTWTEPTAEDDTSNTSIEPDSDKSRNGNAFTGTEKIKYIAMDEFSNTATCEFTVTITFITCSNPNNPNNGAVECPADTIIWGQKCTWSCYEGYELEDPSTESQECTESGTFSKSGNAKYIKKQCPDVRDELTDHMVLDSCTDGNKFESTCTLTCEDGFGPLDKPRKLTCQSSQTWEGYNKECIDIEPPYFDFCPSSITVFTERGKDYGIATWPEPTATDNLGPVIVQRTVGLPPGGQFPVTYDKLHQIIYSAIDSETNEAEQCMLNVNVIDRTCGTVTDSEKLTKQCNGSSWGSSCIFSCEEGYLFNGSSIVYCEEANNGTTLEWDYGEYQPFCHVYACHDLTPPENGALACSNWVYGRYCQMSCRHGYDIPRTTEDRDGEWVCDDTTGIWSPSEQPPNCIPTQYPDNILLPSTLFYFTGNCTDKTNEIRESFIQVLSQSDYSSICSKSDDCKIENVDVACGPITRRRKSIRETRSTHTHMIKIEFSFSRKLYFPDDYTTDNALDLLNEVDAALFEMADLFEQDVLSGAMDIDIPGLPIEVDNDSFSYGWSELACPYGTQPNYATLSCSVCPQGTMYDAGTNACQYCPVGTYQNEIGQLDCKLCPVYMSTLQTGATKISQCKDLCDVGHYSSTGLEYCTRCPLGEYQDERGTTICKTCPSNTTTLSSGSTDLKLCLNNDAIDNFLICNSTQCNGGFCITDSDFTTRCVCHGGYKGDTCETPPDPCDAFPCENGGSCTSFGSSFSCDCPLGFIGQFCQEHAQNGGYTAWSAWTECPVTCGTGTRSHMRECTNPSPGTGGLPCQGEESETEVCGVEDCPECESMSFPHSYNYECEITDDEQKCTFGCKDGWADPGHRVNTVRCGPRTDYVWIPFRFGNRNRKFPSCGKTSLPKSISMTYEMKNSSIPCGSDVSLSNANDFISDNSNCTTMHNCHVRTYTECSKTDSKRSSRSVNSMSIVFELVGVLPDIDYFPNGIYDGDLASIAAESWMTLASDMSQLLQSLKTAVASNEIIIVADDQEYEATIDYFPDQQCLEGKVPAQGLCVTCPVGMYQLDSVCVLCQLGFYQDHEGQASCIQCPAGYTTLSVGSDSATDCLEDNNINTSSTTTSTNDIGTNYSPPHVISTTVIENQTAASSTTTQISNVGHLIKQQTPGFLYPTIGTIGGVLLMVIIIVVVVMFCKKSKIQSADEDNMVIHKAMDGGCEYESDDKRANGCKPAVTTIVSATVKSPLKLPPTNRPSPDNYQEFSENVPKCNRPPTVTSIRMDSRPATAGSIKMSFNSHGGSVVGISVNDVEEQCNPFPQIE